MASGNRDNERKAQTKRTFKTPKGTELPILDMRGKEYLEVKYRLVWFREDHPDWTIDTEMLSVTEQSAYARATIKDDKGRTIATSHKFESKQGFFDFIEKAETGAIGRALALIGYGTQFCADELDEGERIVDSPTQPPVAHQQKANAQKQAEKKEPAKLPIEVLGDYRITFGRKYKDMRLRDVPMADLESFVDWLIDSAKRKGVPLSSEAHHLKNAVERYKIAIAGEHEIKFGNLKGSKVKDVSLPDLIQAARQAEEEILQQGKELSEDQRNFFNCVGVIETAARESA